MRNITPEERAIIADPAGHWFYATLDVEDADLAWRNAGALAIGTDTALEDFFNSASWTETIDQNTPLMSAVLRRDVGNYSLSPYRSDSPANARTDGTFGPVLDIHRHWRIRGCVMPRGAIPDETSYRELQAGRLDLIDIQDDRDGQEGTITVQGRGMEQDVIDSYVMTPGRQYGNLASTELAEVVIQNMLDDQMGVDEVPLAVPTGTGFGVSRFTQEQGPLMPQVTEVAALAASVLRYRHDSADANLFTLIIPNRSPTTPDWVIGPEEWRAYTLNRIDKSGIRNYIKAKYPDSTLNSVQTVISPAAEPGTVTAAAGVATFSASQAGVLAVGAIIVVADRPYKVLTFDGTTGATLSGEATFTAATWHTSASITRYGLRPLLIDFTKKAQVVSFAAAGNTVDALRSDLEDPAVERAIDVDGLWFVQLYDYVQLNPDGKNFNEVSFGGVTAITQKYENGMLRGIIGLRGKPSGGYRRWLSLGSGAPRVATVPGILQYSADYWEEYDGGGVLIAGGVSDLGTVNGTTNSVEIVVGTDPTYTLLEFGENTDVTPGGTFTHEWEGASRGRIYYLRATPWSGPLVAGVPTGIAGPPAYARTYVDALRPTMPQFDVVVDDVAALTNEPFTTHAPSLLLPSARTWVDRPGAVVDLSVAGEVGILVDATTATVTGFVRSVSIFENPSGIEELWTTIGSALVEPSTKLRRRAQIAGATSARIVGTITETTAPDGTLARVAIGPVGGAFTDLTVGLPLHEVGEKASNWFAIDPLLAVDAVIATKTFGGDGAGMCALSSLKVEFAITGSYVDPGDGFSDPFDEAGPLDTPWIPFTGPGNDVKSLNWATTGDSDGAGVVTLAMTPLGVTQARGYYREDVPADSVWAIEQTADSADPGGGNGGIGVLLYELSSGKFLRFGVYDAVAVQLRDAAGTLIGSSVAVGDWGATQFRMKRNGANLEFWYERGSGWTLYGSFAIATYFDDPIAPTTHRYGFFNQTWTSSLTSTHGPWDRTV